MTRYRLRFLLQEFDLPVGDTLIGRGAECRITIVDPLMSRRHARVRIEQEKATFEDLGSRNGSRLNGALVKVPQVLADGDRLRLGTQELVFSQVAIGESQTSRQTGCLRQCAKCGLPYPEEAGSCPHCGSGDAIDEDTLTGKIPGRLDPDAHQSWALQLLVEMLEKALALGRTGDADRIVSQATAKVDERLKLEPPVRMDRAHLDALADAISKLTQLEKSVKWLPWILDTYARAGLLPPVSVVEAALPLPPAELSSLRGSLENILNEERSQELGQPDFERLLRLQHLHATLRGS